MMSMLSPASGGLFGSALGRSTVLGLPGVLGVGGVILGGERALGEGDWTVLKHGGRDYLPLREIGQFYRLGSLERSAREFNLRIGRSSLRGALDSQEFFITHLKFILSYPIREIWGELCMSRMDLVKVLDPVMRPSKIASTGRVDTVVLDAGHGGADCGAAGRYGYEKDYTLDVAHRAQLAFLRAGFRVEMTRRLDQFISLEDRVRFGNQFPQALFISIHFNSSGHGTGVETFTLAPRGVPSMAADGPAVTDFVECPGNVRDAENMALATAAHAALVSRSGMVDRGIKRARFFVIRESRLPSVLLEGGFLTNPEDMRRIANADYRQLIAQSILDAVQNYRRALTPGMA